MGIGKKLYAMGLGTFRGLGLGRFDSLHAIDNRLKSFLTDKPVEVHGHKMWLDDIDSLGLATAGVYEPFQTRLSETLAKEGEAVVDMGAYMGHYTLIFARLVGERGHVFAFEPEPQNFALLARNVEMAGYAKRVSCVKKAVSDETATGVMYLNKLNKGSHSMGQTAGSKTIEIEAVRLDDFFSEDDAKISIIKMDIEGSEAHALRGMRCLLQRCRRIKILTEFNPTALSRCESNPEDFLRDLEHEGFGIYKIDESSQELKKTTIRELMAMKDTYTNLLCVREE